jgi:predicted N-acetyltransferase YhbS
MIERIDELRLTAQDEAQIAALLIRAFGDSFAGRSYYRQRHHVRLVVRNDGRIAGHVALCLRDIRVGDKLIPIIGLAEVATDPTARGKGFATALLKAAIAEARQTPAQFFVLFGDLPLYGAYGFGPQTNMMRYVDIADGMTGSVREEPAEGLMVKPLREVSWDATAPLDMLGHLF